MTITTLPSAEELSEIYLLMEIKGFGPQKFKELRTDRLNAANLIARPHEFQRFGKRGNEFRQQLESFGAEGRRRCFQLAEKQLAAARSNNAYILTYDSEFYPRNLFDSNLPVPVLYVRGNIDILKSPKAVACVGSRKIRPPYEHWHEEFAKLAVRLGLTIVSGFATGADIIGHVTAESERGKTICVMPSGLDRPFPPEHKDIWRRFIEAECAVFTSEFGFGVGANSLNLRKRNKMIVGMANGVMVSQSSEDGGAMNAYRFAIEQKKAISTFKNDGTGDTSGNELIEGSAEKVKLTVLGNSIEGGWGRWLQSL